MLFRLVVISTFAIFLTSCEVQKEPAPVFDDLGGVEVSDLGVSEDFADEGILSGELKDITPGTQEELVALIGDRVFFSFNSAVLDGNAQKTLQRQAKWLLENKKITVTVEGHTDERGTREYNLALGERRSNAARNYLISLGVSPDRVYIISYGKEHPEYIGSNEVAWSKNRRAVTIVNE